MYSNFDKYYHTNEDIFYFTKVPNKLRFIENFGADIPEYLEVDYINMTVTVLHMNIDYNLIVSNIKYLTLYLKRLYN